MGNVSVKAHKHKRIGRGHKHKHNRFCTRRHHRYGGGLSPLNPEGKPLNGKGTKTKKNVDIPLSKFVTLKSAHKSQREGDSARERKRVEEINRIARREQFFKEADAATNARAKRISTRKTPIIHISHTSHSRTLKNK